MEGLLIVKLAAVWFLGSTCALTPREPADSILQVSLQVPRSRPAEGLNGKPVRAPSEAAKPALPPQR